MPVDENSPIKVENCLKYSKNQIKNHHKGPQMPFKLPLCHVFRHGNRIR